MEEAPVQLTQSMIIRKSMVMMFLRLIVVELLIAVVYLGIRFALAALQIEADIDLSLNPLVLTKSIFFMLIEIFTAIFLFLKWANNYYILREKEIIYVTGIISRRERNYSLDNIQSISSEQGLVGRILNYGTIKIFSPALQRELFLTDIPDPKEVVEKIKQVSTTIPGKMGFILRR